MPQYPVPQYVDVIAPKQMPAKKNKVDPEKLKGKALVKEVNRRIRLARKYWDAHNNAATRRERTRALEL